MGFLLFFERAHVNAVLCLWHFKSNNELCHWLLIGRLKNNEENSCFWLVYGKNSEDFFYFLHCFSIDQSEAELLYFYSLFFSVKKPFQKTNPFSSSPGSLYPPRQLWMAVPNSRAWSGVAGTFRRSISSAQSASQMYSHSSTGRQGK
jgi:hypothetical protein